MITYFIKKLIPFNTPATMLLAPGYKLQISSKGYKCIQSGFACMTGKIDGDYKRTMLKLKPGMLTTFGDVASFAGEAFANQLITEGRVIPVGMITGAGSTIGSVVCDMKGSISGPSDQRGIMDYCESVRIKEEKKWFAAYKKRLEQEAKAREAEKEELSHDI